MKEGLSVPDFQGSEPPGCIHLSWSAIFTHFEDYFLERGEGKEKERERNITVWLPLMHPLLGTWPATQACALTGNPTGDPLVHRPALNPLSHTSQGRFVPILFCPHHMFKKFM